jgi:hypothetical protein
MFEKQYKIRVISNEKSRKKYELESMYINDHEPLRKFYVEIYFVIRT